MDSIPDGYRVKELSTSKPDKLTIENAEDYRNATIEVRTSTTAKEVLPVEVVFLYRQLENGRHIFGKLYRLRNEAG